MKRAEDRGLEWRLAFARQSQSDRNVYDQLCRMGVPACHRLHALQMFLEKLAKAFRCSAQSTPEEIADLQKSHKVIEKVMPQVVQHYWAEAKVVSAASPGVSRIQRIRSICRELDLLAPAVADDGRRKDNCEYPWLAERQQSPVVVCPRDESFRVDDRLNNSDGIALLKIASFACEQLVRTTG